MENEWSGTIRLYKEYEDFCEEYGTTPIPFGYNWRSHWSRMTTESITGDIDYAIRSLIASLVSARDGTKESGSELAHRLICQWDKDRGNGWFLTTKRGNNASR